MADYRISERQFVLPTPAGTYYAVSHELYDPVRAMLCSLLRQEITPLLSQESLEAWCGLSGEDALEALYLAQTQGWIEGFPEPRSSKSGALEEVLPELLSHLSDSGRALLADDHGFCLSATGFTHEAGVELAALSADIASLDERHSPLTRQNLRLTSGAWALVDAAGNSQIGFWPLNIDDYRFVLILQGVPLLHQPGFTSLVWSLSSRYAGGKR
jgi:hypothetical protein